MRGLAASRARLASHLPGAVEAVEAQLAREAPHARQWHSQAALLFLIPAEEEEDEDYEGEEEEEEEEEEEGGAGSEGGGAGGGGGAAGGPPPPRVPELDQEALASLLEMGFSEALARNALLLNRNHSDQAVEWLVLHSEDPGAADPIRQACGCGW